MHVYKYNLTYKMHMLLIRLELKRSFNSQVNVFFLKKLHGNFVIMFSNASDISATNFASRGVNKVL